MESKWSHSSYTWYLASSPGESGSCSCSWSWSPAVFIMFCILFIFLCTLVYAVGKRKHSRLDCYDVPLPWLSCCPFVLLCCCPLHFALCLRYMAYQIYFTVTIFNLLLRKLLAFSVLFNANFLPWGQLPQLSYWGTLFSLNLFRIEPLYIVPEMWPNWFIRAAGTPIQSLRHAL